MTRRPIAGGDRFISRLCLEGKEWVKRTDGEADANKLPFLKGRAGGGDEVA